MRKHRGSAITYAVALALPGSSEKRLIRLVERIASHLIKVYGKVHLAILLCGGNL
jgi:hypothetical protein